MIARTTKEEKTIELMIKPYCKHHHIWQNELCPECHRLLDYALLRLKF
jgi:hypothetical protein